jgi:hypothetical protein
MSNSPQARAHAEAEDFNSAPPESTASGGVSADALAPADDHADLHQLLRTQVRQVRPQVAAATPELDALLTLVSDHYEAVDEERRGIVKAMHLMADEARAMALEARQQSSEHLQVILDHIKDVVLTSTRMAASARFIRPESGYSVTTRPKSLAGASTS